MMDDEFGVIMIVGSDYMDVIDAAGVMTDIHLEGFLVRFEMFHQNAIEVNDFHGFDLIHVDNNFILGWIGKEDKVT